MWPHFLEAITPNMLAINGKSNSGIDKRGIALAVIRWWVPTLRKELSQYPVKDWLSKIYYMKVAKKRLGYMMDEANITPDGLLRLITHAK